MIQPPILESEYIKQKAIELGYKENETFPFYISQEDKERIVIDQWCKTFCDHELWVELHKPFAYRKWFSQSREITFVKWSTQCPEYYNPCVDKAKEIIQQNNKECEITEEEYSYVSATGRTCFRTQTIFKFK